MASFTDEPVKLTPYIAQQPIQAMATVGAMREEKFQEGINTVQNYYDSLLALPIAKRETQDYVKNKVGQLNSTVKQSISGDFSNQRLLNQIGGLAGQISNDPVVQNGVQSTAKMQAGFIQAKADQEANIKNGKNPTQNAEYFSEAVNHWLSDGKVDSNLGEYTDGYTPYVDIVDRAMKLYKDQNSSQDINADAFRYDDKGQITVNPTLKEGISPQKIQSALNLVYQQPDVQKQLNIEGWWKFKGATPEQMGSYITENANIELKDIETTIRNLQIKAATDATANPTQIQSQVDQLKNRANQIKAEHQDNSDLLTSGKDAQLKAKLAQQGITSNFINAYSTEIMKKNPLWEAKMDIAKYELDQSKFALSQNEFTYKQFQDNRLLDLEQQKLLLKAKGKLDANGNPIPDTDVFTVKGNMPEEAGKLGSTTFEQHYQEKVDQMNQGQMGLVFSTVNNSDLIESGFNPVTLDPATGRYKLNVDPIGKTGYTSAQQAQAEYDRLYTEGRTQIMGGTAKQTLKNSYQELDPFIRSVRALSDRKQILDSKKQVIIDEERRITGDSNPDYIEAYIVQNKSTGWESSLRRLQQKYGVDWEKGLGIKGPEKTNMRGDFTGYEQGPKEGEYNSFKNKFDKSLAPKLQQVESEYRDSQMVLNPLTSTILANKPEEKENIRQIISTFSEAKTEGNGAYGDFRKLLATKPDPNQDSDIYGFQQDPLNHKFYVTVKRGKGQPEKMEISEQEFNQLPGAQSTNQFWQKFGDDLSLTNNTTTDIPIPTPNGLTKPGGLNTAYLLDMPPTSKYEVRYHVTGDGNGSYNLKMYILDKKGNVLGNSINPGLKTGMNGIILALDQFKNDQLIQSLLK